jgi:hypothetical protein
VEELHHNEPNCRVFIATTKCDLVDDAGEVFPGSNRYAAHRPHSFSHEVVFDIFVPPLSHTDLTFALRVLQKHAAFI